MNIQVYKVFYEVVVTTESVLVTLTLQKSFVCFLFGVLEII